MEERAKTAAEIALRVRQQLDGRDRQSGGDNIAPKQRRRSQFRHQRAQLAVQEDYFSPTPLFDNKQFERVFTVTKQTTQNMLNICEITDPIFTSQRDVSGRYNIDPALVKVLMAVSLWFIWR